MVAQGIAQQVTDPEELAVALDALVDHSIPGRSGEVRRPNAKELAKTAVVRLVLDEVSAKTRADGADDDEEDLDLPYWAGVIPVSTVYGTPEPHESSTGELPAHLQNFRR